MYGDGYVSGDGDRVKAGEAAAGPGGDSRAVAAMFRQYETVFYTNTDISSNFSSFKGLSRQTAGALSVPFGDLIYGLDLLDPCASANMLAKSEAALMGSKGCIPPEGEGAAQVSSFCYIVNFGTRRRSDFGKFAAKARETSKQGEPVWSWQVHSPEPPMRTITYYAAQIGDSYLLVSNDLGELQAIMKRLTSSDDASMTLSGIRDWTILSQHKYWGYRCMRHDGVVEKDAARLEFTMPGAETSGSSPQPHGPSRVYRMIPQVRGGQRVRQERNQRNARTIPAASIDGWDERLAHRAGHLHV